MQNMTLERWESEQRKKGNVAGAEIARALREQYGDEPLPCGEVPVEIKRFTPEARKALEEKGYLIYTLTGQSIKSLRESGRKFWSTRQHGRYPGFEALPSKQSEVAINPRQLFLPKSNGKILAEQEAMVKEFSRELGREIEGVKAIIGEAPDYAELAFLHFGATGERLFGLEHKYAYTITTTKTSTTGDHVAFIGCFLEKSGLYVDYWSRTYGTDYIWAAPLVLPA